MSFGGMLATALAGGANVIGKQAGDDIDQQRKTDLMTQQAAIEEQMRMRLAEHNERLRQSGALADVTGPLGDAKFANKVRELAAATDADVDKAKKLSVAGREAAKANAADPDYLKSVSVLKLADPEVRAHIAQMGAAAGASAAETRMRQEQLKQLGEVGKVASTVRSLQAQLARTTDPEQRKAVEQQITDLGFNGKDIKSFLSTAEKAMTNGDTAMKILLDMNASEETKAVARQQLAKANDFAEQAAGLAGIKPKDGGKSAAGAPAVGTEINGLVFKGGDPYDKKNWQPKAAGGLTPHTAAQVATDSNDRTIKTIPAGYGTNSYRYAGKTYSSLKEAEAAKREWDSISTDDYFKTPG